MQSITREELEARLREYVGKPTGPPAAGLDPVNAPMIRHWCDALDDRNPIYTDPAVAADTVHGGLVAPPTMLQAWSMRGAQMARPDPALAGKDLQNDLHLFLTDAGYPSVVATNCEQEYTRYLRPDDEIRVTTVIESISEQKATALGIGYFIDTRTTFRDARDEEVGWMTFRVLKFKPNEMPAAATGDAAESGAAMSGRPVRLRPAKGHDNAWWWDGLERGELLIQKCTQCGAMRHPPRPMCGVCQSLEWEGVASAGRGSVYSFTVLHHPKVPGYEYPLVVATIALDEGTRLVSNLVDVAPEEVSIGMRVVCSIDAVDDEMKLPLFRPEPRS